MAKKTAVDLMYDELKSLSSKFDKFLEEYRKDGISEEKRLSKLEVKAGMWGGLSGLIGGVLIYLFPHRG